jgi:hypothetical protein
MTVANAMRQRNPSPRTLSSSGFSLFQRSIHMRGGIGRRAT